MKSLIPLLLSLSGVFAHEAHEHCTHNNCARALINHRHDHSLHSFHSTAQSDCSKYISNIITTIPTYAAACTDSANYKSACSCFALPTGTSSLSTESPRSTEGHKRFRSVMESRRETKGGWHTRDSEHGEEPERTEVSHQHTRTHSHHSHETDPSHEHTRTHEHSSETHEAKSSHQHTRTHSHSNEPERTVMHQHTPTHSHSTESPEQTIGHKHHKSRTRTPSTSSTLSISSLTSSIPSSSTTPSPSGTCTPGLCPNASPCNSRGDCVCYATPSGSSFCASSQLCDGLDDCETDKDCEDGRRCATGSCCLRNVCLVLDCENEDEGWGVKKLLEGREGGKGEGLGV